MISFAYLNVELKLFLSLKFSELKRVRFETVSFYVAQADNLAVISLPAEVRVLDV